MDENKSKVKKIEKIKEDDMIDELDLIIQKNKLQSKVMKKIVKKLNRKKETGEEQ